MIIEKSEPNTFWLIQVLNHVLRNLTKSWIQISLNLKFLIAAMRSDDDYDRPVLNSNC